VKRQLNGLEAWLREGCVGHIAEIYSGLHPYDSKGCFAQAWSVGELLRVYEMLEKM
jgi:glycogen debranching enzyme